MVNKGSQRDGKVKKQQLGAGIGLRLSEALGRAFGLWWDGKLLEKLETELETENAQKIRR